MVAALNWSSGAAGRWPTVNHDFVESCLSASQIIKVTFLEHFTIVANHLSDIGRIVPAVFWADIIDVAAE